MGIDKPDVRLVVHWGVPKTVESYYQQAGRAGRDGDPSRCVLFTESKEWQGVRRLLSHDTDAASATRALTAFKSMQGFCETKMCRRIAIVRYFEEGEGCVPGRDVGDAEAEPA